MEVIHNYCEQLAIEMAFLLIPPSLPPQPSSLTNYQALKMCFQVDCGFLIRNSQGLFSVVTELMHNKHSEIGA